MRQNDLWRSRIFCLVMALTLVFSPIGLYSAHADEPLSLEPQEYEQEAEDPNSAALDESASMNQPADVDQTASSDDEQNVDMDIVESEGDTENYADTPQSDALPMITDLTNVDHVVSMKLVNFPAEELTNLSYCVPTSPGATPRWYETSDDPGSPALIALYKQQDSFSSGTLRFVPVSGGSAGRYLGLRYQTASGGNVWTEITKPFPQVPAVTIMPKAPVPQAFRPEAGMVNMLMVTFNIPMDFQINEEMELSAFATEMAVNGESIGDLGEGKVTWITTQVVKVVFPATLLEVGDVLSFTFDKDKVKAANGGVVKNDLIVDPCVADTFAPVGKIVPRSGMVSEIEIVFNELIAPKSKDATDAAVAIKAITLGEGEEQRQSITPTTLRWGMRDGRDVLTVGVKPVNVGITEYFQIEYTDLIQDFSGNRIDVRPKAIAIGGAISLSSSALPGTTPILHNLRELSGGKTPKVAILSSSDSPYQDSWDYFYENTSGVQAAYGFALFGFEPIIAEITCDTYDDQVIIAKTMKSFEDCTAVFGPGGDQSMNSRAYLNDDGSDTELMRGMRQVFHSGGVISGSSAGDHSLSNPMISGGKSGASIIADSVYEITVKDYKNQGGNNPLIIPGYGFVSAYGITDSHVDARSRLGRLLVAQKHTNQPVGIGVGENTSIAIVDGIGYVFGASGVMISDVSEATYPESNIYAVRNARLHYLTAGDQYNFTTKQMTSSKPLATESEKTLSPSANIFPESLAGSRTTGIEALIRDLIQNTATSNYGTDGKAKDSTATLVIKKDEQTKGYYVDNSQYAVTGLQLNVDIYDRLDDMLKEDKPPVQEYSDYRVSLVLAKTNYHIGETFAVDVMVGGGQEQNGYFSGLQADVRYDRSLLEFVGPASPISGVAVSDKGSNYQGVGVTRSGASTRIDQDNGCRVVTLVFKVKEDLATGSHASLIEVKEALVAPAGNPTFNQPAQCGEAKALTAHNLTVEFRAGTGTVMETKTAYVKYGEPGLSGNSSYSERFSLPVPQAADGYRLLDPLWSDGVNGYNSTDFSSLAFTESAVFIAQAVPTAFNITYPTDLLEILSGLTLEGKATTGTEIALKWKNGPIETGYALRVTYQIGSDGEMEMRADEQGIYRIPGSAIIGDIIIRAEKVIDGSVSFIAFDEYNAAPTGFQVALLHLNNRDAQQLKYLYNDTTMFWSSKYEAYVCFVDWMAKEADVLAAIHAVSGESEHIAYDGNVNCGADGLNGVVNITDAVLAYDLYNRHQEYLEDNTFSLVNALMRLEADVNGDKVVDTQDVWQIQMIILGITS